MTPVVVFLLVLASLAVTVATWITAVLSTRPSRATWGEIIGIATAVACFRWTLAAVYGPAAPYWDQWNGEAATLLIPYLDGNLSLSHLVASHNEHRIWFTRMEVLGLVQLTGTWDPTQQMCINAVLHGMAVSLIWLLCAKDCSAGSRTFLGILAVALMAGPIHWENSLAGFQSQFAYCLLFTAAANLILPRAIETWGWWLLLAAMLAACLFTVGSGFLAAVAAASGLAWIAIRTGTRLSPRLLAAFALCAALTWFGIVILSHVAFHDQLRSGDITSFFMAFGKAMGWPAVRPLHWLILWLPGIACSILSLRGRPGLVTPEVFGLAVWVVLQSAALAYSRGTGGAAPSGRHLDLVVVSLILSARFLFVLLDRYRPAVPVTMAIVGGWFVVWLPTFLDVSIDGVHQSAERLRMGRRHGEVIHLYLATSDPSLMQLQPLTDLPCWSGDYLKMVLDHQGLVDLLPPSIRGLPTEPEQAPRPEPRPPASISRWEWLQGRCRKHADGFAATGLLAAVGFAFLSLRGSPRMSSVA